MLVLEKTFSFHIAQIPFWVLSSAKCRAFYLHKTLTKPPQNSWEPKALCAVPPSSSAQCQLSFSMLIPQMPPSEDCRHVCLIWLFPNNTSIRIDSLTCFEILFHKQFYLEQIEKLFSFENRPITYLPFVVIYKKLDKLSEFKSKLARIVF